MTKLPELKTLVNDVYSLFNQENHHTPSEENLEAFAENVKELLRQRLAKREPDKNSIRFSNLGKPDRVHWYKANGYEGEAFRPQTLLKFLYGDLIEQLMVFLIKESGHTVEDEQREIELDGILGHIDAIIDGHVADVKSASPFSFQKFEDGSVLEKDPFGYVPQISGYENVIRAGRAPTFIAFDKVHGDVCVREVPEEAVQANKPAERIAHLKQVITQEEPPKRCYEPVPDGKSGNMKLGTECSYCEFKKACWPGLRTFLYSNGPRHLVTVAKLPDVFEAIG